MGWYDCLQQALDYIEDHLTDELSIEDVAAQAYLSPFHFQHVFSALCGMPLGEYIRCRRLTLAAQELSGPEYLPMLLTAAALVLLGMGLSCLRARGKEARG